MKRILFVGLLLAVRCVLGQDQIKLDSLSLELKNAKEDTLRIDLMLQISRVYFANSYPKAVDFGQQAKILSQKKGLSSFEAKADRALGNLFLAIGDYKNASTHYFTALKFYEETRDTLGILSMHNNLGVVYDRLLEFDEALEHYLRSRDLYNQLGISQQKAFPIPTLYNNIGNIYQTKADIKSALQYYERALQLAVETNNVSVQGIALNNLGKLYLNDLKQPVKALEFLLTGLKVREANNDQAEIAKSLIVLSHYHLQQKEFDAGKQYALRAIKLGAGIGSLEVQQNGYSILSEIEEAIGSSAEALAAYKYFKEFHDSIQNQQASSEITRLQLQYNFEKAEKVRAEESRQSRNQYIIAIVALSAGLMVAVLITVVVRLRSRQIELKQKNLAQDVEIKNKELTTNVMYLIRKNELINNVAERLLKVEDTILPENRKTLHDIILELQRESDNDNWKEFELRFNQVHSEFYTKLRSMHQGLSPADEKLCAFLRLNMSSKEIASISQQSIKSVEVARARLRKKLNLTNTTSNLVTYLSTF